MESAEVKSESSEATTVRERLASKSPWLLGGALALALLVAVVAGFGIGMKVEQGRKSSSKTKATAAAKNKAKKKAVPATVTLYGKVTSANGKTLTVKSAKGKSTTVTIAKATVVRTASKGASTDIRTGWRVLYKGDNYTKAKEVLVLPSTGKAGLKLAGVTKSSMTIMGAKGKRVTVQTTGAAVDKTAAGKVSNVTKNTGVIVVTRRYGKVLVATEIIVLPPGSAFV